MQSGHLRRRDGHRQPPERSHARARGERPVRSNLTTVLCRPAFLPLNLSTSLTMLKLVVVLCAGEIRIASCRATTRFQRDTLLVVGPLPLLRIPQESKAILPRVTTLGLCGTIAVVLGHLVSRPNVYHRPVLPKGAETSASHPAPKATQRTSPLKRSRSSPATATGPTAARSRAT
jgi:hypothetical protein